MLLLLVFAVGLLENCLDDALKVFVREVVLLLLTLMMMMTMMLVVMLMAYDEPKTCFLQNQSATLAPSFGNIKRKYLHTDTYDMNCECVLV